MERATFTRMEESTAQDWSLIRNEAMGQLGYSSKLNAEWPFLSMLREEGRRAADQFLAEHGDAIGKRSSLDLDQLLEGV